MSSWFARLRVGILQLWRIDTRLAFCAALMLPALAACALGLWLDPRLVLAAPVWFKPAKFALSIFIYCLTLSWLFSYIPQAVRTRRIVGWTTALVMLLELGIIALQAARGTTSHFNVSTPFDAVAFAVMGTAILVQTVSSVAVAAALFRTRFADRTLGWAMRLGMVISIAGASLGGVMTRPTQAQLAQMRTGHALVSGAHTVGAPDGGPGIPVLGWSREHGDIRAAHFVGLHALQLLPLLALGLRRTRASQTQRTRLLLTAAGSYAVFVGIMAWQALRARPALSLDATSLVVLAAWLALTVASTWRSLAGRALPSTSAISIA